MPDNNLKKNIGDSARYFKELVCEHQGRYVQFAFFAFMYHKALGMALDSDNKEDIIKYHYLLKTLATNSISTAAQTTFGHLQDYFASSPEHRSHHSIPPRICLKLLRKKSGANFIYTRLRYDRYRNDEKEFERDPYEPEYPLNQHSIFYHIQQYDGFVVKNDIPKAIETESYKNGRIESTAAKRYYQMRLKGEVDGDVLVDDAWLNCWNTPPGDLRSRNPRWCYKSTMVVPVTLEGHIKKETISRDFIESFREKLSLKRGGKGGLLFGFVCIDHVATGYFRENSDDSDVSMAYVVADLISLYVITKMLLIDRSDIFERADKKVRAWNQTSRVKRQTRSRSRKT